MSTKTALELKQVCGYLPYELKGKYSDEDTIWTIDPLEIETNYEDNKLQLFHLVETDGEFKPFLRPLSDLTKQITHNGETFVPLVEIAKILEPKLQWELKTDSIGTYAFAQENAYPNYIRPYQLECCSIDIFDKLYEWMFDIHGLIDEGLAIPVTEELNPYK